MTTPPDLRSVVLRVQALDTLPATETHKDTRFWGSALHSVFMTALAQSDPALAKHLHDKNDIMPFTVSDLYGWKRNAGLAINQDAWIRFTGLTADVCHALQAAVQHGNLKVGNGLMIDDLPVRIVEHVQTADHAWVGQTTYEALSAPWLLSKQTAPAYLQFKLSSPTRFKRDGHWIPHPLPDLVFGSLLSKWNKFAPIELPPELKRFSAECLATSHFRLNTRTVNVKGSNRPGAEGIVRFVATNRDRYWLSCLQVLAQFSRYCGLGAGTTMGLGQCRVIQQKTRG